MNQKTTENAALPVRINRFPFLDNIYTTIFTPSEHQVSLLDAASKQSIVVCLASTTGKDFMVVMMIKEYAHRLRGPLNQYKRCFVLANSASTVKHYCDIIRDHTNVQVTNVLTLDDEMEVQEWDAHLVANHVVVTLVDTFTQLLQVGQPDLGKIALIVIDECHLALCNHPCRQLLKILSESKENVGDEPHILGLSMQVLDRSCEPATLERRLRRLEAATGCPTETSSSLALLGRHSCRPEEVVVECGEPVNFKDTDATSNSSNEREAAAAEIRQVVERAVLFLRDHQHRPEDLYGSIDDDEDDEEDRLLAIPDPTVVPLAFLADLLDILATLGPWCADRAAWFFMKELRKHKDKTPYERHYLLLSVAFTVMEQTRAICDFHFRACEDERSRLAHFSGPKLMRLQEILRAYRPSDEEMERIKQKRQLYASQAAVGRANNVSASVAGPHPVGTGEVKCGTVTEAPLCRSSCKPSPCCCKQPSSSSPPCSSACQKNVTDNDVCCQSKCCDSFLPDSSVPAKCPTSPVSNSIQPPIVTKCCSSPHHGNGEPGCQKNCKESSSCDTPTNVCDQTTSKSDASPEVTNIEPIDVLIPPIIESRLDPICKESDHRAPVINQECTCGASTHLGSAGVQPAFGSAAAMFPGGTRHGGWRQGRWQGGHNNQNRRPTFASEDPNSLWGIVFVERRYAACVVNMYLKELSKHEPDFGFLFPNFIMGQRQLPLSADGLATGSDPRELQLEHRKQEEVLRRFRLHECNLLVATAVVEDGVDLPRCNLVVRLDRPKDYTSYAQSKGRAKAIPSLYLLIVERRLSSKFLAEIGQYWALEEILLSRCHGRQIPIDEQQDLKAADLTHPPYFPNPEDTAVKVTMSLAITIVNRYCARLPSDTFTRLVPRCAITRLTNGPCPMYQGRLSLPINSPIKQTIVGSAMPNEALAKMSAALETCKVLHRSGELDDQLMPMGKLSACLEREPAVVEPDDEQAVPEGSPRPGTTKRRQYYNKQIAEAFQRCLPLPGRPAHLYRICMKLTCPIPEEQNIRGRQIYEPASTSQGFGLLTSKKIPAICGFPVFTRSGEVTVRLSRVASGLRFTADELEQLTTFHRYTFANVLRLEKYPMCYDHEEAENSLLVVPLNCLTTHLPSTLDHRESPLISNDSLQHDKRGFHNGLTNGNAHDFPKDCSREEHVNCDEKRARAKGGYELDWPFIHTIVAHKDAKPQAVLESQRRCFRFDVSAYRDAVVMPWYRNLDQPQYFYVAEVCHNLSPHSDFPDDDFETFEKYYLRKYGLRVQDPSQPLLDVDHTSARLNLLTPRYVNRKGVALPTSSDQTKKAKRENLQQKQILVPELCSVHPFSASLWRKAVCLPCVLYRLNCLLLSEEMRVRVAREIGLGLSSGLGRGYRWPTLDFGWSLADIIRARRLAVEEGKVKELKEKGEEELAIDNGASPDDAKSEKTKTAAKGKKGKSRVKSISAGKSNVFTIGTWSNDMAADQDETPDENAAKDGAEDSEEDDEDDFLPDDLMLLNCNSLFGKESKSDGTLLVNGTRQSDSDDEEGSKIRYGSPSNFESGWDLDNDVLEADMMNIHGFGFVSTAGGGMNNFAGALGSIKSNVFGRRCTNGSDGASFRCKGSDSEDDDEGEEVEEERSDTEDDGSADGGSGRIGYWKVNGNSEGGLQPTKEMDCGVQSEMDDISSPVFDWDAVEESENAAVLEKNIGVTLEDELQVWIRRAVDKIKFVPANENLRLEKAASSSGGASPSAAPHPVEIAAMVPQAIRGNNTAGDGSDVVVAKTEVAIGDQCAVIDNVLYEASSVINGGMETRSDVDKTHLKGNAMGFGKMIESVGVFSEKVNFNGLADSKYCPRTHPEETVKVGSDVNSGDSSDDCDDGITDDEGDRDIVVKCRPDPSAEFSFDEQPNLSSHPGPSPSVLLQSLTMSNANDGINLERLETIGDSFLKHAITSHLFCAHPHVHEGRLSHLRSKQVSNLRLYRLGRRKGLGRIMVATKFEPNDNWLPPGYLVPAELEQALIDSGVPAGYWNTTLLSSEATASNRSNVPKDLLQATFNVHRDISETRVVHSRECPMAALQKEGLPESDCRRVAPTDLPEGTCFIPYNLMTQHSVPDKSIADCVEAQIGAYLTSCGPQGALLFMSWLGIDVLPKAANGSGFGLIVPPPSPLQSAPSNTDGHQLEQLLHSYGDFESQIGYQFRDRSYLLQAFTHASYHYNRLTDCYQRLEFLGDAVLDYLITRHLYEDKRQHSPGTLTDLRSALVNNTIFATLAVRYNFHKYFKALCPNLFMVIDRFIRMQKENDHQVNEEYYFMEEEECEEVEDIEVPKALGDVFESVAGAIYLDSGMSLDTVWNVYYAMMRPEIELFSTSVPKSPIRELLEKEPETAKFGKPERTLEGKVRVTVEIFGKGRFTALGRNYRIAKCTAAKHALKALRKLQSNVINNRSTS